MKKKLTTLICTVTLLFTLSGCALFDSEVNSFQSVIRIQIKDPLTIHMVGGFFIVS